MVSLLTPTIWRSCRALANSKRLALLKTLAESDACTVSDLAHAHRIPVSVCSDYLRILSARGLLRVTRRSRWVYYEVGADADVRHAAPLLAALCRTLKRCKDANEIKALRYDLTSFTHPRRIEILRQIFLHTPVTARQLSLRCAISLPALNRHLDKLESRRVVHCTDDGYKLYKKQHPVVSAILAIITADLHRSGKKSTTLREV